MRDPKIAIITNILLLAVRVGCCYTLFLLVVMLFLEQVKCQDVGADNMWATNHLDPNK